MALRMLMPALLIMTVLGCSTHTQLVVVEEQMAVDYIYVGTFAESHDPARQTPSLLIPYLDVTGCRRRVIERAAAAGATHLVWLYDYGTQAAAMAYRCPELCGKLPEVSALRLEWIGPSLTVGSMLF